MSFNPWKQIDTLETEIPIIFVVVESRRYFGAFTAAVAGSAKNILDKNWHRVKQPNYNKTDKPFVQNIANPEATSVARTISQFRFPIHTLAIIIAPHTMAQVCGSVWTSKRRARRLRLLSIS